jgi:hypothetical protein
MYKKNISSACARFFAVWLLAMLLFNTYKSPMTAQVLSTLRTGKATGPLFPHPDNPRYFTDGSGKAIYLTGSHTWANLQDLGVEPVPIFDWDGYLDMMVAHNHNFMRLWHWRTNNWGPRPGYPERDVNCSPGCH